MYLDREVQRDFSRLIYHATTITRKPRLILCETCKEPLPKVNPSSDCDTCNSAYLIYTSRFNKTQLTEFYSKVKLPGIIDVEERVEEIAGSSPDECEITTDTSTDTDYD